MNISQFVKKNHIKMSQEDIIINFNDKETIVKSQLALALNLADSFNKTTGNNIDDLFAVALLSINNAYEKYDLTLKVARFSTYCRKTIVNSLLSFKDNIIRRPFLNTKNVLVPSANYDFEVDYLESLEDVETTSYGNIDIEPIVRLITELLSPIDSSVVINKLGLLEVKKTFKQLGKEYNRSGEAIRIRYIKSIEALKNNKRFINEMNKVYSL